MGSGPLNRGPEVLDSEQEGEGSQVCYHYRDSPDRLLHPFFLNDSEPGSPPQSPAGQLPVITPSSPSPISNNSQNGHPCLPSQIGKSLLCVHLATSSPHWDGESMNTGKYGSLNAK